MKPAIVASLVAAAVAVGTAAWLVDRTGRATPGAVEKSKDRLFADLGAKVNDVASITVKKGGAEVIVSRKDGTWGLDSKGGYPVLVDQVKGTIIGLADLRPVEAKTSRPEHYAKIGVQDPDSPAPPPAPPKPPDEAAPPPPATPTLLTLKDSSGAVLASAIIGTQKYGTPPEVYIRKAGDAQSWLAEGRLELPGEVMGWLERQIVNIGRERIKSVTVTHPDGQTVAVTKEATAAAFKVENVPAGRELNAPTAGDTLGSALSYVTMEDVAPADQLDLSSPGVTPGAAAEFRTFDGLVIRVQTATKDGKLWALFDATYVAPPAPPAPTAPATPPPAAPAAAGDKPADQPAAPTPEAPKDDAAKAEQAKTEQAKTDAAKKEAADLGAKLGKWAFVLPEYKGKVFQTKIDELLKPLPAPAPAPTDTSGPAGPQPLPSPVPPAPPGG